MLIGGRTLGHDKDSRLQQAGHLRAAWRAFFWSHAEDTAQPPAPLPSFPGTSGFCQDTGVRVFVRKETNLTRLFTNKRGGGREAVGEGDGGREGRFL